MRIAYCTNVRLPSERAHGHQIAQVCDALVKLGHDVTVFHPFRHNVVEQDYWTYYGADRAVRVRALGSFDFIKSPFTPAVLGLWFMNASLRRALRSCLSPEQFDLAYTRAPALLPVLLDRGMPVVLELHRIPRLTRRMRTDLRRCTLVVCLTRAMERELLNREPSVRTVVAGDAVRSSALKALPERDAVRRRFGIPRSAWTIGYAGQLESAGLSKGIPELLGALERLRRRGISFHALLAGGPDAARRKFQASMPADLRPHITFVGHLPPRDVRMAHAASDVLVYPAPQSDHPFYQRDTSPLKLFEYMAAGRPIVTADLPPVRDVLSEDTAVFCVPGDPSAMADSLLWVAQHPEEAQKRADAAREIVRQHTWEERMRRILEGVQ